MKNGLRASVVLAVFGMGMMQGPATETRARMSAVAATSRTAISEWDQKIGALVGRGELRVRDTMEDTMLAGGRTPASSSSTRASRSGRRGREAGRRRGHPHRLRNLAARASSSKPVPRSLKRRLGGFSIGSHPGARIFPRGGPHGSSHNRRLTP